MVPGGGGGLQCLAGEDEPVGSHVSESGQAGRFCHT